MPKISTGKITTQDIQEIKTATERVLIKSKLKCFSEMNGIRPSELSVLVGQRGNGKSTLCKTIAFESLVSGVKTLIILSEEKTSVYKNTLNKIFTDIAKTPDRFVENLYLTSMLDWEPREKNFETFFEFLEDQINDLGVDLVIFDNFTTSFFGSLHISKQGDAIENLRILASDYEIAILGVFHTAKGTDIYKKILDGEDVRGNATSTNAGSYNFILSTYFRAKPPVAYLNVDKARYHKRVNKTYWELEYDHDFDIYTGCVERSFLDVKLKLNEIEQETNPKKIKEKFSGGW